MNNKKSSLWETRKVKIAVRVINICIIAGLLFYLVFTIVTRIGLGNGMNKVNGLSVSGKEYIEAETESAEDAGSDQMASVYYALLQGAQAEISRGVTLKFGLDGSFEGFFDNEHPDVTGYTYEIFDPIEDCDIAYEANVNIYNADKSIYVQYKLLFDENSNMQLYYPDSKEYISLSFE